MTFVQIKTPSRFKWNSLILIFTFFTSLVQGVVHPVSAEPLIPLATYVPSTNYPTLTAIGQTPTPFDPISAVDFSCPVGTPIGAGIVTPSTDWLYACGQCLATGTPVLMSTSTAGPTLTPPFYQTQQPCQTPVGGGQEVCNTPIPTVCHGATCPLGTAVSVVSPTPTVSPVPTIAVTAAATSTAAGLLTCKTGITNQVCQQINPYTLKLTGTSTWMWYVTQGAGTVDVLFHTTTVGTVTYEHENTVTFSAFGWRNGTWGWANYVADFPEAQIVHDVPYPYMGRERTKVGEYVFENIQVGQGENRIEFIHNNTVNYANRLFFNGTGGNYILVSSLPLVALVETPTPVPATPNPNYCASVSSIDVPNQFDLTGTGGIISQSCGSIPELSFQSFIQTFTPSWFGDMSYFISAFPTTAILPALTVCIRQRDYSLYIWGIRMPIELILGLSIFLSGLRFFVPTVFSGASAIGDRIPTVSSTVSVVRTSSGAHRVSTKTTRKNGS